MVAMPICRCVSFAHRKKEVTSSVGFIVTVERCVVTVIKVHHMGFQRKILFLQHPLKTDEAVVGGRTVCPYDRLHIFSRLLLS